MYTQKSKASFDAMNDLALVHYSQGDEKEKKKSTTEAVLSGIGEFVQSVTFTKGVVGNLHSH